VALLIACWSVVVSPALGAASDEDPAFDLLGTWYVLIHYRDEASDRPGVQLWDDRIWIFEEAGTRLKWTEYSVVAFEDSSQRFARMQSGRMARVEGAWEPSPRQRVEIAEGVEVSARSARSKLLRGSVARGFRSSGGIRTESTSVIGFSESWEIRDLDSLPLFRRDDVMDSSRTEELEGSRSYQSRRRLPDGNGLEGDYDRDGSKRGSFRMLRAGEVLVRGEGKKSKR